MASAYSKARKRLRDYLSSQRRKGIVIKTKLPELAKRPTSLSTERLEKLYEKAKEEAREYRENVFEKERQKQLEREEYESLSARDLAYLIATNQASLVRDDETGEIVGIRRKQEAPKLDTSQHIIETAVYDWTRNGTQTEFTTRIEYFIEKCIGIYGKEVTAEAIQIMINNGNSLTRMERYNNDYCHDWIAEFQNVLREIPYEKKVLGRTGESTSLYSRDLEKEFEDLFKEANEDNYNGQLDAEVYEQRYEGKFKNVSTKHWWFR